MKRLLLSITLSLAAIMNVSAGDYDYLIFTQKNNPAQAVTAIGTTITFTDGNMKVVSGGETVTIPLADVSEMYFSSTSGIDEKSLAPADGTITVYTTSGQHVATYQNADDLSSQLKKGIYVIRQNGETRKIAVR